MKVFLFGFALCVGACVATPEPGPQAPARLSSAVPVPWTPKILSSPDVYLPDFSYAGYHFGERALPDAKPTVEATDYGVTADDATDDTEALKKALAATLALPGPVVLHLPKGRILLSDTLFLERSNLTLQGSGSGAGGTTLFVTRPMADMPRSPVIEKIESYLIKNDKRVDGKPFSPFSWTGGVLWTRRPSEPAQPTLAHVLSGRRGQHELQLDAELSLKPGSILRVRWFNRAGDDSPLLRHMYGLEGVKFGPRLSDPKGDAIVTEEATIKAVQGHTVTLVQPLLHDIRAGWTVDVVDPQFLQEVGIEHLALEFVEKPYGGHHTELGFNGIYLTGIANSFVRDVVVKNSDSALLSDDCANVTVTNLAVTGRLGHYGVHLGDVFDVLLEDFQVKSDQFHSVSFNTKSRANVATHGSIYRPSLDQHRGANHQNLFDDLNTLEDRPKSMLFEHGGADYWGPTHGAFNTFWNIHVNFTPQPGGAMFLGRIDDAGPVRLIGLVSNAPLNFQYDHAYEEGRGVPGISVPSLYQYQLAKRLGGEKPLAAAR